MNPMHQAAVDAIVQFFETLSPGSVRDFGRFYTDDATFKDPFNEVRGLAEIQRIFAHMYVALDNPRFVITGRVVEDNQCFLTWDFMFAFKSFHKGVTQTVRGSSHLRLAADGRIAFHRDYWDTAEELYQKVPVLGGLVRWLTRHAGN
ncbi:MAG TPA: nuclear transport factor 2 family protein [Burkholderiaceae bacterium]